MIAVPWNPEHTNHSAFVVQFRSGAIAAGCLHNGCRRYGWRDLREKFEPEYCGTPEAADTAVIDAALRTTDLGNAMRFVTQHGDDARYVPAYGAWLLWDGKRFRRDELGLVEERAKRTVRSIWAEVGEEGGMTSDERVALARWARMSGQGPRIEAMLRLARTPIPRRRGITVSPDELDADPWLFNVKNGTLNLRTGTLQPHCRTDPLTKLAPVVYEPGATAPTWNAFLATVLPDESVRGFVQRIAGYSLTGLINEQVMAILYGIGRNGKSTFVDRLHDVAGEYARVTDFSTFTERRGDSINNDLARLQGARLVSASEGREGGRLAEALIKRVTGDDRITARFLYHEFFEYQPQFKLWLVHRR